MWLYAFAACVGADDPVEGDGRAGARDRAELPAGLEGAAAPERAPVPARRRWRSSCSSSRCWCRSRSRRTSCSSSSGTAAQRATHVPWYYYLDKLDLVRGLRHAAHLAGRDRASRCAGGRTGDRLLLFWVFVVLLFFQVYPLKAFNYLLPLIPAVSILAGPRRARRRAGARAPLEARCGGAPASGWMARGGRPIALPVALLAPACMVVSSWRRRSIDVARTDSYFGLREAAKWLKANTSPEDGVMTLSKGSAQYAISFYARRDAYPFGRFRLATVLPGRKGAQPAPGGRRPVARLGQLLAAAAGQEPRGLLPRLLHRRG